MLSFRIVVVLRPRRAGPRPARRGGRSLAQHSRVSSAGSQPWPCSCSSRLSPHAGPRTRGADPCSLMLAQTACRPASRLRRRAQPADPEAGDQRGGDCQAIHHSALAGVPPCAGSASEPPRQAPPRQRTTVSPSAERSRRRSVRQGAVALRNGHDVVGTVAAPTRRRAGDPGVMRWSGPAGWRAARP